MKNVSSKSYKLLALLEEKPLEMNEISQLLHIDGYAKILATLCGTMKLYLGELKNVDELPNHTFIDNFALTMKKVIAESDSANLGETLKSIRDIKNRCLKLSISKQDSTLLNQLQVIETLLVNKLDVQYKNNHYEFISYLVYEIKSLQYIRQTLISKPYYVNAKNESGQHIVLELIDKYINLTKFKGNSKELSYYANVIFIFVNTNKFHLSLQEIAEYTDLLQQKLAQVEQDKRISILSFYKEMITVLNKKQMDQEIIQTVNNEFGITIEFSKDVQDQMLTLVKEPYIITIDSEKTLDMDDALSITKQGDKYQLHIYISDVARYLQEGSVIDREAYKRMETLYFANPIIPMLPVELSNDLLSLNNHKYKPVIEGIIDIYENGTVGQFQLRQNYILVNKKCSYEEINDILKKGTENKHLLKTVQYLSDVATLLKGQNENRSLYREIKDMRSTSQGIERHKGLYKQQTAAEIMIEETMVLFNSQTAEYFAKRGYPCLYRVHPGPTTTQAYNSLMRLKEYILESYQNPEEYTKMANSLLSMYPQAYYSLHNIGHYGLDKSYYCHATSPIRRYPDIILQRLIYDYIFSEPTRQKDQIWLPKLTEMCQYCNERMDENIQYQMRMQYVRSSK